MGESVPEAKRLPHWREPALWVAAAIVLMLTLDWFEDPHIGAVERLGDLAEILITIATAAGVAWWIAKRA